MGRRSSWTTPILVHIELGGVKGEVDGETLAFRQRRRRVLSGSQIAGADAAGKPAGACSVSSS
jgi:hypothetical protein